MGGICEVLEGDLGRQPSYPLLVLQSLTSAPPVLIVHSDLKVVLFSGLRDRPNSSAHPIPCSPGLSMMKERLGVICRYSESAEAVLECDEGCAWRFARCTDADTAIESRAVEIRPEGFLTSGVGGGRGALQSLLTSAEKSGVILGSESVSDGKTRSKGTSCPSFLRSLSIFCLRRLFKDVML